VVDEWTNLSREANDDVIATDVRRRDEMITTIVDINLEKDGQSGVRETPARKLKWQSVIQQDSTVH